MDSVHHVPVLLEQVLAMAEVRPGQLWVDCTCGFGGHSEALLLAGARLIAVEQDAEARDHAAERLASFGAQVEIVAANFRDLDEVLDARGLGAVDGILADIGVSSFQLDQPQRGFSFQRAGPVDMRMDRDRGEPASALIARLDVGALADHLRVYGEERFAGRVARAMKAWAAGEGPHDTLSLAAAVAAAVPGRRGHKHPATRSFQALRIAVNDELGALDVLLGKLPALLNPGGRALIITFHSLEDRRVKRAFAEWAGRRRPPAPRRGLPPPPAPPVHFELLRPRKGAVASAVELDRNPRARSARLRGVMRRGGEVAA